MIDYRKSTEAFRHLVLTEDENVHFPTICTCSVCGGVNGMVHGGLNEPPTHSDDKELATIIALMQHGYYLKSWEGFDVANKKHIPFMCQCASSIK